jgi:hypothetical protein
MIALYAITAAAAGVLVLLGLVARFVEARHRRKWERRRRQRGGYLRIPASYAEALADDLREADADPDSEARDYADVRREIFGNVIAGDFGEDVYSRRVS